MIKFLNWLAKLYNYKLVKIEHELSQVQRMPRKELTKFEVGDRVVANQSSGFHKGATGIVKYVEPAGRIWVRRDNASSDVFFYNRELDKV